MNSVKWKREITACLLQSKTSALKLENSSPSQHAGDTTPGKFQMMAKRPGFPKKEVKEDLIEALIQEMSQCLNTGI